jgi:general stress protein YciG
MIERAKEALQSKKSRRGFASMNPDLRRELASKGGRSAHALGTAHKWNREEAQAAGRKGGSHCSPRKGFGSMSIERRREIMVKVWQARKQAK